MEIEARRAAKAVRETPASAAHPAAPAEAKEASAAKYLATVPADLAPPEVGEVPPQGAEGVHQEK